MGSKRRRRKKTFTLPEVRKKMESPQRRFTPKMQRDRERNIKTLNLNGMGTREEPYNCKGHRAIVATSCCLSNVHNAIVYAQSCYIEDAYFSIFVGDGNVVKSGRNNMILGARNMYAPNLPDYGSLEPRVCPIRRRSSYSDGSQSVSPTTLRRVRSLSIQE